jgi:hypothetical protein
VGCTVIAVWSWRLARRRAAGRALDAEHMPRWLSITILAGVGAALGVVAASVAGMPLASPVFAACLLLGVDMVAGSVAVNNVRHDPPAESVVSWWWYAAAEVATFGTAIGKSWVFWASPGTGLLIAAGIIGMAWKGGERISLARPPRHRQRPRHRLPPPPQAAPRGSGNGGEISAFAAVSFRAAKSLGGHMMHHRSAELGGQVAVRKALRSHLPVGGMGAVVWRAHATGGYVGGRVRDWAWRHREAWRSRCCCGDSSSILGPVDDHYCSAGCSHHGPCWCRGG